jgi:lysophospholipase L1-like esterase
MAEGSVRGRWLVGSIVVCGALLLSGGVVWADGRNHISPPPALSIMGESSQTTSQSPGPPPERPTFAVLGDSYAEGDGADWQTGWVQRVADTMCWSLLPVSQPGGPGAQPGTGFTNAGGTVPGTVVYLDRVAGILAQHPQFVLVEGGTNDRSASPQDIAHAATETFNAIKKGMSNGAVLAIGPVVTPSSPESDAALKDAARVSGAIAAAAQAAEVAYIDPVGEKWLDNPALWSDNKHPNKEGYAEYANRVVDKFVQAGIVPSCK